MKKTTAPRWLQLTAAVVGNALEWYDFGVFAALAAIIAKVYFPASDDSVGLLLTLATFGVGFVTRPLGGIAIGVYADRRGRKAALQLIIGLMTGSLLLLAFTPSYATIGWSAPLLIVLARLLQGVAAGGEFASATAYLLEAAPAGKKGFYGSWQMFGQSVSILAGAVTGLLLTSFFSEKELIDGMWRIPFVFGLLIAPIGWWIRRHLEEPGESVRARSESSSASLGSTLSKYPRGIAANLLLTTCATAAVYIFMVYMPTYATRQFGFSLNHAYMAQALGLSALTVTVVISGILSDRYGRKAVMLSSIIPYALLIYPFFAMIQAHPTLSNLMIVYSVLSVFLGGFLGPFATALGEQFPTHIRSSSLAICYNVAVMVFGGFAPFIVTWLIATTGLTLAPILYTVCGSVLGVIGCFLLLGKSKRLLQPISLQKEALKS